MPRATVTVLLLLLLFPAAASAAPRDRDRDRMADAWERRHHVSKARGDRDRDGLTNLREHRLKTNPRRRDTDRDGLRDGAELRFGWHPRVRDGDRDGLLDGRENAGVVVAVDGLNVTIRLASRGGRLTGRLEDQAALSCAPAPAIGSPPSAGDGDGGDDGSAPADDEPFEWNPAWGEPPTSDDDPNEDVVNEDEDAPLASAAQVPSVPEDEEEEEEPWTDEDELLADGPTPKCRALLRKRARVHEATSEPGAEGRRLTRLQLVS